MSLRHKAREIALQKLFEYDFNKEYGYQSGIAFPCMTEEELEGVAEETKIFAQYLIEGTLENISHIDNLISKYSKKWTLEKISRVDRNILRMSIFSLLFIKDIHATIVIDESVKLSREYSSDVAYKFINGILDAIKKNEI